MTTDIHAEARKRYEQAAALMRANLAGITGILEPPESFYFFRRLAAAQRAEEQDRAEWIEEVKQRLGLVTVSEGKP